MVEVEVNNTSGRYTLPDDSILRNETIIALSVLPPVYDQANAAYLPRIAQKRIDHLLPQVLFIMRS